MKIVFLSNFLLHHQIEFCEEMTKLCESFWFVATSPITEERLKLGYKDYSKESISYYFDGTNPSNSDTLQRIIEEADAVIIGSAPWHLVDSRVKAGKLVFIYSERIFKTFVASLKAILKGSVHQRYVVPGRMNNVKLLCASAYLPFEMRMLRSFKDGMYRWGYFPPYKAENNTPNNEPIKVLFAGRLIGWKRPHYVLKLAKDIKQSDTCARIRIVGTGHDEKKLQKYAVRHGLEEIVTFTGSMSPDKVRDEMVSADIFLFPSTKEEGWGAVLNEAMNSKCAVIASSKIGSVPFMIQDQVNGIIFADGSYRDFKKKFFQLSQNRAKIKQIGNAAYATVAQEWNGVKAAQRLTILVDSLLRGKDTPFVAGPCSKIK